MVQAVEPCRLVVGQDARLSIGREPGELGSMAPWDGLGVFALGESLRGVLPDRLEHPEPGFTMAVLVIPQEALVHKRRESVRYIDS